MKFDDLIGVPYKSHGRSKEEGFDCYGLVLECCRRAGTPLADIDYTVSSLPDKEAARYAEKLNVEKAPAPRAGYVCEMEYNGNLHLGYMIDRNNVLHMTEKGARVTYIGACKAKAFYKVGEL